MKAPSAPPPPPPPPGPDEALAARERVKMQSADEARRIKGRASTLLTSGEGDTSAAPVSTKSLLGK